MDNIPEETVVYTIDNNNKAGEDDNPPSTAGK